MPQDQLFKDLLRAFFREFQELFYPDVAARLDFERVTFLDKETFTDLPEGSRREADLVAQVYTQSGEPEVILIHVEVQTQRRGEFPYRMSEYYALLRLRHKTPVFPIVVYLAPGVPSRGRDGGGLVEEQYSETLFGRDILTFQYQAVGLPDLSADDYLAGVNPLVPALAALMRPGATGRALRKALSLRQTQVSDLDAARRSLLIHVIDTYLPLASEEAIEFQRIVGQPEFKEVKQMVTSFEQQGIERGIERGVLRGKRDALLRLARVRFGALPERFSAHIEEIATEAELDTLLERAATATSLDEIVEDAV